MPHGRVVSRQLPAESAIWEVEPDQSCQQRPVPLKQLGHLRMFGQHINILRCFVEALVDATECDMQVLAAAIV